MNFLACLGVSVGNKEVLFACRSEFLVSTKYRKLQVRRNIIVNNTLYFFVASKIIVLTTRNDKVGCLFKIQLSIVVHHKGTQLQIVVLIACSKGNTRTVRDKVFTTDTVFKLFVSHSISSVYIGAEAVIGREERTKASS